jgi:hypothetical protein
MITPFSLTAALAAMGVAEVFIGDPLTPGGMASLGAVEGTITANLPSEMNNLTAPELTGGVAHQATVTPGEITVVVPVILGDPTILAKISPIGANHAGYSTPQKVLETAVLIIPRSEVGGSLDWDPAALAGAGGWTRTAGNGVAAAGPSAPGGAAAPKNAIWFWRAYPTFASLPFSYGNGGKVITEVTFHAMFDASKPEGHKIYSIGDPRNIAVTPILVDL